DTGELSIFALEADVEQTSAPVWSSDNTDVATVGQEGNVTAVGAGQATITVTVDNASATSTIVVQPNVYVAGRDNNQPVLWINGEKTVLSEENGYARSVYVDGDDVYVAGQLNKHPALWKNGEVTLLAENSEAVENEATSVYVDNGVVYVAGQERRNSSFAPLLWVDGTEQVLPFLEGGIIDPQDGLLGSVYVKEGKIYVAGTQTTGFAQAYAATLWENGLQVPLEDVSFEFNVVSYAYSVFVDDNSDVFVAGKGQDEGAVYWKNGAKNVLSGVLSSRAKSVYVSNGNVYCSGFLNAKPALWTNNQVEFLSDDGGSAEEVFVDNDVVYVAGEVSDFATLWIDGEPMELPSEASSYAHSVFVK
ncbi:Ig-like domain-containing protein, partial [Muricauda oceani]